MRIGQRFLAWWKVGPGPWDPGPWDPETWDPGPPQSLKVGPGILLKFGRGTPGPPSKFKRWTPGLYHSLMKSIFFQNT